MAKNTGILDAHRDFLSAFGGDAALAARLSLQRQAIYQWRKRGIAWRWRPHLVRLAQEENIPIPPRFLAALQPSGRKKQHKEAAQ